MTPARWIAVIVLVLAVVFAWTGGTFSEGDYRALQREEAAANQRLIQLTRDVDSLRALRDSLTSDPAVQERVARDELGMLRPGEIVFTMVRDSDTAAARPPKKP